MVGKIEKQLFRVIVLRAGVERGAKQLRGFYVVRKCSGQARRRFPHPCPHCVDHGLRSNVVKISCRGGDGAVAQLLADDPHVDALLPQLARVCMPQAVGMDPLLDADLPA